MPMTCPAMFTSGPPELPGLMAASVWMASMTVACEPSSPPARVGRCSEDTMPEVTVPDSSNGDPMATTLCPTRRSSDRPRSTVGRPSLSSARTTATSDVGSRPTMVARAVLPSWNTATIWPLSAAPSTTWLLVTISPSELMMKPEPSPAEDWPLTCNCTTLGSTFSATASTDPDGAADVCLAGGFSSSAFVTGPALLSATRYPPAAPAPPPTSSASTVMPTTSGVWPRRGDWPGPCGSGPMGPVGGPTDEPIDWYGAVCCGGVPWLWWPANAVPNSTCSPDRACGVPYCWPP